MSSESPISVRTAEDARRQLDSLLDELADLAEGASSPEEFWPELLSRLIFAASAQGAAIWQLGASRRLQPLYEQGFDKVYSAPQRDVAIDIDACSLEAALRKPKASAIVSGGESGGQTRLMLAVPLETVARTSALLVLYQPADLPAVTQNGQLRLLDAFGEIAVHFQERRLLADFAGAEQNWKNQLYFARDVHRELDVQRTCYRIANDGRLALDADRVSVAEWDGPAAYIQAISGIDVINRRAAVVRKLERLATAVAKQKQPIIFRGDRENLPPQIEDALVDYLEESPARLLIAVPLVREEEHEEEEEATAEGTLVGVMIVEQLEATEVERLLSRTRSLAETASIALDNAQRYEKLPLRGVMQFVGMVLAQFGWRKLSRTMRYVLPVLLVLLATWLIPARFEIDVRGQLQPEVERQLFAPLDGYVDEILVKHGQMVDAGEVVAKLRSPDLELKQTETAGLLAAAQSELDAVRVERTQNTRRDDDRRDNRSADRDQLSADEIRLTRRIANLQEQLLLLDKQQQSLTLTAPVAGQILSWDIDETLQARPVSRGDSLLKVAEVDGPWVLKLEAADRRTKHILDAQAATKQELPITFHLVSEPGVKHQAKLTEVSQVIDVGSETDEPAALLTASFDKTEIDFLRPGVSVSGRVDCGTRSLAYVWTHELWEAVRRRLFW
ncbi:biotin/lipoyl-binding protein [Blastopirellula sp. JC732]|uniref:Biotin/lipoyl-binding protein n=1 Tax=Blastopirellula sediminis TaxID=2894196 RepID=A0A9X1MRB6_9BACT|nr:biotin/lipoyl-binding protein [Blastopirellula sediminis]MCC9605725.1 biotin/lipoyl-binding protein [Blastopirellula sediminis]MCC9630975.1 biotin/lipoyl-binding protein [Blastopirellula sediminis]